MADQTIEEFVDDLEKAWIDQYPVTNKRLNNTNDTVRSELIFDAQDAKDAFCHGYMACRKKMNG